MNPTATSTPTAEQKKGKIFVPLNLRSNSRYRDGQVVEILGPDPKNEDRLIILADGEPPRAIMKEFVYES